MIDLYRNIRDLRIKNGWSQGDLAKRAGYKDRSAIAHIEDGTIDLPQSKIRLFAKIFGVTPASLFGESGIDGNADIPEISDSEYSLVVAYRKAPEYMQQAICDMLHIKRGDASSYNSKVG